MSKFFIELTWNDINWGDSYSIVRRSQQRIFKASQLGDNRKVRYLQQRLIRSPYAKVIAVKQVTTINKDKNTSGVDGFVSITPSMKLKLAKNLHLNGKASLVKRVWISKPEKTETIPLFIGISTIKDQAKQALAKLALEPEWEAKFEPNSYGFRPGRGCHDAIEAIFMNLRHKVDKLIYDANIHKSFTGINHKAILNKLESFPLMERQIQAWLQAGIMEEYANIPRESTMGIPQGGGISPLLSNIALHGFEKHLKNYVSSTDFSKPYSEVARGTRAKRFELGVIRYADDFVIIHQNPETMEKIIVEIHNWLAKIGLKISAEKSTLRWASQSFKFLGFQITLVKKQKTFRVKITPAKENIKAFTDKTRIIIQNNKSASSSALIYLLRPVLLGWGNYFQYCECKETFKKVDNIIYNQLRAWVLRRALRKGRIATMRKYFIEGKEYRFQNRTYKANWIFSGSKAGKDGKPVNIFLPKISWISSKSYAKVTATCSIGDGDNVY